MTKRYTIFIEDAEYQAIRKCATFTHGFSRNPDNGEVTFTTRNPRKLASDLERLIDFGATSAADVLDLEPGYRY